MVEGVAVYRPLDPGKISAEELKKMIDFTLLKPELTEEDYSRFLVTAGKWGFGRVFVPPCYIGLAVGILSATDVMVGAPVSFPFGYTLPGAKAGEALEAIRDGATEIDVVMNVSAALSGEWEMVEEDLAAVVCAVREIEEEASSGRVVLKVILETPYLDDEQKAEACRRAEAAGMDYVKTATGLGPGGATVPDVKLMRETVGDRLGVKASGGVRTWEDARAMIEAGADRIGTSTGPELVEDFIRAGT
jgi:deoxyribose-phosphate aldolase